MRIALMALALITVSCGTASSSTTSDAVDNAPTGTVDTSAPAEETGPTPAPVPEDDVIVFLTVIDDTLDGTTYEGLATEDPEALLAMGQLFCDLRDGGMSDEDALVAYLTELEVEGPVTDDDALLVGVTMGAAFEALCPATE